MGIKEMLGGLNKLIINKDLTLSSIVCRNNEIDDTDIDGEKVMMDLENGKYFMINDVGSRIWEIIESPISIKEIIKTLLSEYKVDDEECKNTVIEFLSELQVEELVKIN